MARNTTHGLSQFDPRMGSQMNKLNAVRDQLDRQDMRLNYHIVTEKDGWERHLHAALFLKRDDHKSNLNNRMCRRECMSAKSVYKCMSPRANTLKYFHVEL